MKTLILVRCSINNPQLFRTIQDICHALSSAADLMKKYDRITIIFPGHSNHPTETTESVLQFCNERQLNFSVIAGINDEPLMSRTAYIVINESDLAQLIKKVKYAGITPGKEIGIISFNETSAERITGYYGYYHRL